MNVSSVLEIYTTFSAWIFNNVMVDLLKLGFIVIPFLFMIILNVRDAIKSANFRSTVEIAIKHIEMDFWEMMLIFMLCFIPVFPLQLNTLAYTPPTTNFLSQDIPETITAANDPSTYATRLNPAVAYVQSEYGNPRVPVVIYLMMRVSYGITYAMSKTILDANARFDIGAAKHAVSQFTLNDPALTSEFLQFSKDCFEPARTKFIRLSAEGKIAGLLSTASKTHLEDHPYDINYYGSTVFQNTPGLYQRCTDPETCNRTLQASRPISGWSYDPGRDGQRTAEQAGLAGQPRCDEWWAALRQDIIADAPEIRSVYSKIKAVFGLTTEREEDLLAENVVRNAFKQGSNQGTLGTGGLYTTEKGMLEKLHGVVVNEGLKVTRFFNLFKTEAVKNGVLILLAIGVMLVYINAPLILLFTGFRLKGLMITGGLIFTFISAHYLIALVDYIGGSVFWGAYEFDVGYFNISSDTEVESFRVLMSIIYPIIVALYFLIMNTVIQGLQTLGTKVPSSAGAITPTNPINHIPKGK